MHANSIASCIEVTTLTSLDALFAELHVTSAGKMAVMIMMTRDLARNMEVLRKWCGIFLSSHVSNVCLPIEKRPSYSVGMHGGRLMKTEKLE